MHDGDDTADDVEYLCDRVYRPVYGRHPLNHHRRHPYNVRLLRDVMSLKLVNGFITIENTKVGNILCKGHIIVIHC